MKLGTHNTLSYNKPQWYFRIFNFIGKCQDLNIYQQYDAGVRYYDIRVKIKNNKVVSGHGLLTYNINIEDILDFLNDQATCKVRIVLENDIFDRIFNSKKKEGVLISFMQKWLNKYTAITFTGCYKKRPWTKLIEIDDVPHKDCFERYEGKNFKFPYPRYYAKKNNKYYWSKVNDEYYSIMDFINIK